MKIRMLKSAKNIKLPIFLNKNITFWAVFIFFILVQIFLTIQTSTTGATLATLEGQEKELKEKNHELNEELISSSSLLSLESLAGELGYIEPQETFYVGEAGSVAKLP